MYLDLGRMKYALPNDPLTIRGSSSKLSCHSILYTGDRSKYSSSQEHSSMNSSVSLMSSGSGGFLKSQVSTVAPVRLDPMVVPISMILKVRWLTFSTVTVLPHRSIKSSNFRVLIAFMISFFRSRSGVMKNRSSLPKLVLTDSSPK